MTHRPVLRALSLTLALGAAYGCTGGLSCGESSGCSSDYAYPLTAAEVPNGTAFVDDGVRMRMTQRALDFLSGNIRSLLATTLGTDPNNPDIIRITSTQAVGAAGFTLAQGVAETHPTEIFINARELAENLQLTFVGDQGNDPDGIRLRAANVPVGLEGRLFSGTGPGNFACDIFGTDDSLGGRPFVTNLTLDAIVRPRVGSGSECDDNAPQCLKVDVEVQQVLIGDFNAGSIDSKSAPPCPPSEDCGFFTACPPPIPDGLGECSEDCSDDRKRLDPNGNLECQTSCAITGVALDFLSAIAGFMSGIIEGTLPNVLEGALEDALDDVDGSPIAASGRIQLSDFAPGIVPGSALDLGFAVGPSGGAFDVNAPAGRNGAQGIDLILKSGFEAAPSLVADAAVPNPCVRPLDTNAFDALYGGLDFVAPANAEPLTGLFDGQVYDIGASIALGSLNQALFAAYNAGALCIEASSESIHVLTDGAFPLSAGTLDLLTEGKLRQYTRPDAPAVIALAPSQPPVLRYGSGTEGEGHMIVTWPGVEVSFYVLLHERPARVFAVSTDISLQLTVFNDPATSTLRIAVVDGPNIENFTETYNELLPGVAFTEILESLIGLAFDAALGDGLAFNFDVGPILSNALGGAPVSVDFRGIETLPEDDRQFLNVYLGLESAPSPASTVSPLGLRLAADPGVLRLSDAPFADPRERARPLPTGEVLIEVDALASDVEYFARVDFGAWRGPLRVSSDGVVVITDPKLRLVGEHTLWLRSRTVDDPNSLQHADDAVRMTVWVDANPPRIELSQVGDSVVAQGVDDGTASEDLLWQWQLDDGEWSESALTSVRPLSELSGRRVAVRALDRAGNVSKSVGLDLLVARDRLDEEAKALGGCAQVGVDASWLAATLAGALALWTRRRRAR